MNLRYTKILKNPKKFQRFLGSPRKNVRLSLKSGANATGKSHFRL